MTPARRAVARLLAGALVTLTGLVGFVVVPTAPAAAAYCTTAGGVNVLVDFGELDGETESRCGTSGTAHDAIDAANFGLKYDDGNGMLCQVDGKPAAGQPCTDPNAYWALFVSNEGGPWAYATSGVKSQPVDAGDSVALVWQSTNSTRKPSAAPGQPIAEATPTTAPAKPSPTATRKPAVKPSAKASARGTATATPTASVTPAVPTTGSPTGTPTGSPSATAAATGSPTAGVPAATATESETSEEPADLDAAPVSATDDDGGLPGWVPPVLVVALLGAVGGITLVRRRGA